MSQLELILIYMGIYFIIFILSHLGWKILRSNYVAKTHFIIDCKYNSSCVKFYYLDNICTY
jgi:hypothetical protein